MSLKMNALNHLFVVIKYANVAVSLLIVLLDSSTTVSTSKPSICPSIVSRKEWGGITPVAIEYAIVPVLYVVLHHTVTPECNSTSSCAPMIRAIQEFHVDELEFHDIGYNFLIGSDGSVYEGTGWHKVGAHTRGYNSRSLGIALIGDFTSNRPNQVMLKATQDFLQCAVELGELAKDYKLIGAKQVSSTKSPGLYLYREMQKWPHFLEYP